MMNEGSRDGSLLIGLHKLAQQGGDGLVPELYALLSQPREDSKTLSNVVQFPGAAQGERASSSTRAERGVVLPLHRR